MRIATVITGGGAGRRFGSSKPKQFLTLQHRSASKPIIVWSINAFERQGRIDSIVVTVPAEFVRYTERLLTKYPIKKVIGVVAGGTTRSESVFNSLKYLSADPPDSVLIHDAVRPFVDSCIIDRIIDGLARYPAVIPAVESRDTVRRRGKRGDMGDLVDRSSLLLVQTPQGFRWEAIATSLPGWLRYKDATDDATIVAAHGIRVGVVEGIPYNLKITTQEDLTIARAIARMIR